MTARPSHNCRQRFQFVTTLLVFACASAPQLSAAELTTIVVDFSKPDDAARQASALQAALEKPGDTIALSLAIVPDIDDGKPDYHVKRVVPRSKKRRPVKCDEGWQRFGPATEAFEFSFGTINPHLLLTIRHVSAQQAPFHTVACEYLANGPDAPQLVFKGTFAKSMISVPTAIDVELRPINPE